jgi:hypothetical protein
MEEGRDGHATAVSYKTPKASGTGCGCFGIPFHAKYDKYKSNPLKNASRRQDDGENLFWDAQNHDQMAPANRRARSSAAWPTTQDLHLINRSRSHSLRLSSAAQHPSRVIAITALLFSSWTAANNERARASDSLLSRIWIALRMRHGAHVAGPGGGADAVGTASECFQHRAGPDLDSRLMPSCHRR